MQKIYMSDSKDEELKNQDIIQFLLTLLYIF